MEGKKQNRSKNGRFHKVCEQRNTFKDKVYRHIVNLIRGEVGLMRSIFTGWQNGKVSQGNMQIMEGMVRLLSELSAAPLLRAIPN